MRSETTPTGIGLLKVHYYVEHDIRSARTGSSGVRKPELPAIDIQALYARAGAVVAGRLLGEPGRRYTHISGKATT